MQKANKKRFVSDAEYAEAHRNGDNRRIIQAILNRFSASIDPDDLESCGNVGLWRALQYHNPPPGSKQKFTTSLHMFVEYECRRRRKRNLHRLAQENGTSVALDDEIEDELAQKEATEIPEIRQFIRLLPRYEDRKLLKQRFVLGMAYSQIAELYGSSTETVRKNTLEAVAKLKDLCA